MEEQDLQLRDLTPVEPLLPAFLWPWWVWASLAAGLLLLVLLTVWLVRRKSSKSQTPPNLEDLAFRQALAALDALPDQLHEAALGASLILRQYITGSTGDPTLFETREEFLARPAALDRVPEILRPRVGSLLDDLSRLKYDQPRSGSASEIVPLTRRLIEELHRHRAA